jgi:hypothetical protein
MKTVHFHHPLEEIDDAAPPVNGRAQPYLQAPCADPENCHLADDEHDDPAAHADPKHPPHRADLGHEHEPHTPVDVVGEHGVVFLACPDGHQVNKVIVHALTPVDSLSELITGCQGQVDEQGNPVECDKDLEYVKSVPTNMRPARHNPADWKSSMPWPGR